MKAHIENYSFLTLMLALGITVIDALPNNPSFSSSAFTPGQSNLPNYSNTYRDENDSQPNSMQNYGQSFEERTAAWRLQQQNLQRNQTPLQEASTTDEQGRLKLLANVSKGSISFFFFMLIWRSIHHFELADVSFKGFMRTALVLPTIALFVANMLGCVFALTPANHKTKKRLKLILNANKTMEISLFMYNVFRLTIAPSKKIIREVYVGRTLSNFVFLLQCQLFTKVTWDGLKTSEYGPSGSTTYEQAPVYDDYQPPGVYDGYERFENNDFAENEQQNYQSYPQQHGYNSQGWS